MDLTDLEKWGAMWAENRWSEIWKYLCECVVTLLSLIDFVCVLMSGSMGRGRVVVSHGWMVKWENETGQQIKSSALNTLPRQSIGGEWSASRPGRYTPWERAAGTRWIGAWVSLRAVLALWRKEQRIMKRTNKKRTGEWCAFPFVVIVGHKGSRSCRKHDCRCSVFNFLKITPAA